MHGPPPLRLRLATAAILLGAMMLVALVRPIDGDEGYLLVAARLLSEGELPYRDFFHTQMPLFSIAYGAWFELFGRSWYTARVLSGLLAAGTGYLTFVMAWRVTGSR